MTYRSFGANKPELSSRDNDQATPNEDGISAAAEGSRIDAALPKKQSLSENSQQIEDSEDNTQQGIVDKVHASGLRFKQKARKSFVNHTFEFLLWLPDAITKPKCSKHKNSKKLDKTKADENQEKEGKPEDDEDSEKEEEPAVRDEGVCIVRVTPNKPDKDTEDATTKKKHGRLFVELTTTEWNIIKTLKEAAGVPTEKIESPSNAVNSEGIEHPTEPETNKETEQ